MHVLQLEYQKARQSTDGATIHVVNMDVAKTTSSSPRKTSTYTRCQREALELSLSFAFAWKLSHQVSVGRIYLFF